MLDPFERHGVKNLSASSLNLFAQQPALWVGRYLLKWPRSSDPAVFRGRAVEAGLDHWLYADRRTPDTLMQALEIAHTNFALNTGGQCDEAHEEQRALIGMMLGQATRATAHLPKPLSRQSKIEVWLDGAEVPVVGYLDYKFEGLLVDLKTVKRMPTEVPKNHVLQLSGYSKAEKVPGYILYASPTKTMMKALQPEQISEGLIDMRRTARALRNVLAKSETAEEAASFFVPDFTSYLWDDDATKERGRALYDNQPA